MNSANRQEQQFLAGLADEKLAPSSGRRGHACAESGG